MKKHILLPVLVLLSLVLSTLPVKAQWLLSAEKRIERNGNALVFSNNGFILEHEEKTYMNIMPGIADMIQLPNFPGHSLLIGSKAYFHVKPVSVTGKKNNPQKVLTKYVISSKGEKVVMAEAFEDENLGALIPVKITSRGIEVPEIHFFYVERAREIMTVFFIDFCVNARNETRESAVVTSFNVAKYNGVPGVAIDALLPKNATYEERKKLEIMWLTLWMSHRAAFHKNGRQIDTTGGISPVDVDVVQDEEFLKVTRFFNAWIARQLTPDPEPSVSQTPTTPTKEEPASLEAGDETPSVPETAQFTVTSIKDRKLVRIAVTKGTIELRWKYLNSEGEGERTLSTVQKDENGKFKKAVRLPLNSDLTFTLSYTNSEGKQIIREYDSQGEIKRK